MGVVAWGSAGVGVVAWGSAGVGVVSPDGPGDREAPWIPVELLTQDHLR